MKRVLSALILGGASMSHAATSAESALTTLCAEYWESSLRADPVEATALGDRRYDDRLTDITPAGRATRRRELLFFQNRARALDLEKLDARARVDRAFLLDVIASEIARLECDFDAWVVDPLRGPHIAFMDIPSVQPVRTPVEARAMVRRWEKMAPALDAHIANLRRGLAEGRAAARPSVEKVIAALDAQLERPVAEWTLLEPLATTHDDWPAAEWKQFERDLRATVSGRIAPALGRYRDVLRREVLPAARPAEQAGLAHLHGGEDCYKKMILRHTSLELPAAEIHRIGQEEVGRIRAEMQELGDKVLGTSDLPTILEKLRRDPALHFTTREEVEATARAALARAQAATPQWFNIQPQQACEVVRMEPHEEPYSTIAYYRQPALDGSRIGRYYINTWKPETRPRYEAEALAFHEAVPGHHLQIAIAQELTGLPEFRKHEGCTAFVEGWALYTERLADEMGLYSSDLDRIGKLSFDAWRACRLVVDTGLHSLGWSRAQAIDFMVQNTALAENNIENEVDRYITWPGQALAYKLGQIEILRLREHARSKLGDRFDIRTFHDVILRNGAVTLPALGALVSEWLEAETAER
jgi:uncharacterized protein (DUF885 family)